MNFSIPKSRSEFLYHLHSPLFKNSFYILFANISGAGFGFIFWMLAAKIYSPQDVGIATALISSMGLLVLLSRFGLDLSIIRFFPDGDKSNILSTSVIFTTFFAFIFGIIYIAGIDIWSPELIMLKSKNAILYLLFLIASSVVFLTGISFNAIRKAKYTFFQSMFINSRVLFLYPFAVFGSMGIFDAVGLSFLLASVISIFHHIKLGIKPRACLDQKFLYSTFNFSAGNYISGLLISAPNYILPLIVLNTLGSEKAAYYYIAYSIASLVFMIPNAISVSLFVEGSHGEVLKTATIKSIVISLAVQIPTILILYFSGDLFLGIISPSYVKGFELLRLMLISSLFSTPVLLYFSIKRVQKHITEITFLSGLIFIMLIGFGYYFMIQYGIIGMGYSWILSYVIGSLVVSWQICRNKTEPLD